MATLSRAYASTYDAKNAIERLLSAGLPAIRIELIMGRAIQDARDAPIGTFAGTRTADALTVGSYGDVAHSGREAMGTFARGRGKQRRGSYGDIDRDTVTTYESGLKRTRIASHRRLEKLLVDAGLDTTDVGALHAGRVLVLVHSDSSPDDIAAVIDGRDQSQQPLPAAA
jgi:hypothetical protein